MTIVKLDVAKKCMLQKSHNRNQNRKQFHNKFVILSSRRLSVFQRSSRQQMLIILISSEITIRVGIFLFDTFVADSAKKLYNFLRGLP